MEPNDTKPRSERERTDESLEAERRNTDDALAHRLTVVESKSDELVNRARRSADAGLDAARQIADATIPEDDSPQQRRARNALVREREAEDEVVRTERARADEALLAERAEQLRMLAALLPLEREKTDRHLLTERVRSDEALARRDDFLGIVSHDLRNLLGGIVLSASLVAEAPDDDRQASKAGVARIQRYAARMNRLIGDLVDVVSIDAGKLEIQPVEADPMALIADAVDAFAPSANEKGIALVVEGPETALAFFDADRLFQVLANLITNALKFTPRGGRVSIRGEVSNGDLHVQISDTGCGIPNDLLQAVFERFWQVGAHDRRGLGLGLYISQCIVAAHRGRIWAESEVGSGSVFHMTLPRARATGAPA